MIKYLNIKNICMSFVLLGLGVFQACDDTIEPLKITGDTENKVFVNMQNWAPTNAPQNSVFFDVTTAFTSTFLTSSASEAKFEISARCTKPAGKDIIVAFEPDYSDVLSGYMPFPTGVEIQLDKSELTISKGATISEDKITVTVRSEHVSLFRQLGSYMAPIKMVSVQNASASDLTTIPIIFDTKFTNIKGVGTTSSGTSISKTGWSATGGTNPARLYDGTTTTSSYATIPYNTDIILDMASVRTNISLIRFTYSATGYRMSSMEIYTRESSSEEWTFHGIAETATSNTNHYITFHEKVNARYIKMVFLTGGNASAVRIVELYVHQ